MSEFIVIQGRLRIYLSSINDFSFQLANAVTKLEVVFCLKSSKNMMLNYPTTPQVSAASAIKPIYNNTCTVFSTLARKRQLLIR